MSQVHVFCIKQQYEEQNFHIFYLLYQGMADDDKYMLGDINLHRYINGNSQACTFAQGGTGAGGFAVSR